MSKKIVILVEDKKLCLKKETPKEENIDLNNTNIVDLEKMYFSESYIQKNIEIMSSFLKLICVKKNSQELLIYDMDLLNLGLLLSKDISSITTLRIIPDQSLPFEAFEVLQTNDNIIEIEAYTMPFFMFEQLDYKKGKTIILRKKEHYESYFMQNNKLNTYADIYYAKKININQKLETEEKEEFDIFFRLNKDLHLIELEYYDDDFLEEIFSLLKNNNQKNVIIRIYQKEADNLYKKVEELSKKHSLFMKKRSIKVKIIYSKKEKNKYFLKQYNLTMFKFSLIVIIVLTITIISVFEIKQFIDNRKTAKLNEELRNQLNSGLSNLEDSLLAESEADERLQQAEEDPKTQHSLNMEIYWSQFDKVWKILKETNSDTVAWIQINNTAVDYPVVQAQDNKYYLNRSFTKESNIYGWIFMDYRNQVDSLNQNTIIYGHRTQNNLMFGSLNKVLNANWYKNKENQIINFTTENENLKWEIFSIYTIDVTSDYLTTSFSTQEEFLTFTTKLQKRSIYDFKVNILENDKIITLSTCYQDSSKRLVVHARAIPEIKEIE